MTAKAIQVSVTQVAVGVAIGATIEAVLPPRTEDAPLSDQVFEALVQAGMNGAALAAFAGLVHGEAVDPTFGIPFSMALWSAQPVFQLKLCLLSAVVKRQVAQVVQRMVPRVGGV